MLDYFVAYDMMMRIERQARQDFGLDFVTESQNEIKKRQKSYKKIERNGKID